MPFIRACLKIILFLCIKAKKILSLPARTLFEIMIIVIINKT